MKLKIAILESDTLYLNKLVSALSSKYSDKIEIYSFSNLSVLYDIINDVKFNILVANESFCIDLEKIPNNCSFAYLVNYQDIDRINDQKAICKFQKIDIIYRQMLDLYSDNSINITSVKSNDSGSKVISFSSPCGGVGTTSNAIACSMYLANCGKKTIYLNFERFGSSDIYFSGDGNSDMSDIIYAIKSKKNNLQIKLEGAVKQDISGVFFYSSAKYALHTIELKADDIILLVSELKSSGLYDYIIVDIDFGLDDEHIKIFKEFDVVVMVNDGSERSNTKIFRVENSLKVIEENINIGILNKSIILYNKLSSKNGKVLDNTTIVNIGGTPKFEGLSEKQTVEQLSRLDLFKKLL